MKIQYELLEKAAAMVNENGYILYSTCSIELEEDTLLVQKFISEHPKFTLKQEELLLPNLDHDGAYAAVLCRG